MASRNKQLTKLRKEVQIRYREGSYSNRRVPAAVVHAEIVALEKKEGHATPEALVERARPKSSPMHDCFEWDDRAAAEEHRKMQARTLIRSIEVVDGVREPYRPFVFVTEDSDRQGYKSTTAVVQVQSEFASAMSHLLHKLSAAEEAVNELRSMVEGRDAPMAILAVALQALETAKSAVRSLPAA